MATAKRRLWVVEMFDGDTGEWLSTTGVAITREDARREIVRWQENMSCDRFRVREYQPYQKDQSR